VISRQSETEAEHFPAGAVSFFSERTPTRTDMNNYNWGGYFIGNCIPPTAFYDGRTDLYGDSSWMISMLLTTLRWLEEPIQHWHSYHNPASRRACDNWLRST